MSASFDFEAPDHFTTGTVGPSGQRVFDLQAREARQIVTLKVEKEQVRALAEYLAGLLARLKGAATTAPAVKWSGESTSKDGLSLMPCPRRARW